MMREAVAAAVVVLCGCSRTPSEGSKGDAANPAGPAAGGATNVPPNASGPADSAPSTPVLLQPRDIVPGASNIDVQGLHAFSAGPTSGAIEEWASKLAARAKYVGEDGTQSSVKVVKQEPKELGDLAYVQLEAVPKMAPDSWYFLVIEQDAELRVLGKGPTTGRWSSHFFTGSALRPIAGLSVKTKNPTILFVTFSEPVDLAQIDGGKLIKLGGKNASLCILRGEACADPKEPFISLVAHVRLSVPFAVGDAQIVIDGGVKGSGKTVADGAAAAALPLANGTLTVQVPKNSWESCEGDEAYCWTETRSLPAF